MARQSLGEVSQFVDKALTIMYASKSMTFPSPHIGHSRHGFFLQDWIVNPMLNLLKRTMTYPGFEPGTLEVAVSIPNHCLHYLK
jgi:hypothetical protein